MRQEWVSYAYLASPVGQLEVGATDLAVVSINFVEAARTGFSTAEGAGAAVLVEALAQLRDYFEGRRRRFDLSLAPQGTPFRQAVWRAVQTIPYGETLSYGAIATAIGNPRAGRAVGTANGANPIPIVVPCHRVLGSDGSLTGYGGGLWRKAWLLEHEKAHIA
jgi:methylated-DNA-[protein]-cysteine S-methyltransferase